MDPPSHPVERACLAAINSRLAMHDRALTRMIAQNHEEMTQLTKRVMSLEDTLASTRAALDATRADGGFMSPNAHRLYMAVFDRVGIEAVVEAFNNQWLPNYADVKKESETWKFEDWDDTHDCFYGVTRGSTMVNVERDRDAGGVEDMYGRDSIYDDNACHCGFSLRPCKSIKLLQDPYDINEYELSIHEFETFGEKFVVRPASRALGFKHGKLELDAKKFWRAMREMVVELVER